VRDVGPGRAPLGVPHLSDPGGGLGLMTTAEYDPQDIVREMIRVAEAEGIEP
jgi:hypothetical protein